MLFEASAPGSLMLLGEYGVLYGKPAVVCAVDKQITVKLLPRHDHQINIQSELGKLSVPRFDIALVPPFQFVLSVLKKFKTKLPTGCDIEIKSEFSSELGLGSSAAVTAACLACLNEWLELGLTNLELARLGRTIIQEVQGCGSGADVAACIFGGIIFFRPQPFAVEKLPGLHPLSVIYSGSKLPTPQAISRVEQSFLKREKLFKRMLQAIGQCAVEGNTAILKQDWDAFGKVMNIQQGLMEGLGINTPVLQKIITDLRASQDILGAKISGSGFGDCVIGLGSLAESSLPIKMTARGVCCEKK